MRKILFLAFVCIALHAEFYKIYVTRIDQDLYKTSDGIYIQTKYCYEYAINQEAILKYDQYSYDNELIFDRHQKCDVERIFK